MKVAICTRVILPFDVKIIGWGSLIVGIYCIMAGLWGTYENMKIQEMFHYICFRLIHIDSAAKLKMETLIHGITFLLIGFSLIKGTRFGWWLGIISSSFIVFDIIVFNLLLATNTSPESEIVSVIFNSLAIAWLLFRKKLFLEKEPML